MIGELYIHNNTYDKATILWNDQSTQDIIGNKQIGKLFHKEILTLDNQNKIIISKKSPYRSKPIIALLKTRSKFKFGCNKRGIPYYYVEPINSHLPKFKIALNLKKYNIKTDHYIVLKFLKWEETFPQGCLEKIIGPINDLDVNYESLLYKYEFNLKKYKLLNKNKIMDDLIQNLSNHIEYKQTIVSIDPEDCKDIDDALSLEYISNNKYLLGIHIADVSTFLEFINDDSLWNSIKQKSTTIYLPNKKYNMLPDKLADNFCSLLPNQKRLSLSLFITIDNGKPIHYEWKQTIIVNQKAYSYEQAEKLLNTNKTLRDLYNISIDIHKNYFQKKIDNWDTHQMIETFMVLANNLVAKTIYTSKKKIPAIYRIHKQTNKKINTSILELKNLLTILSSESAIYSKECLEHSGLELQYYTHYTSPIRRYVDIYNHILIKHLFIQDKSTFLQKYYPNLDSINKINQSTKKMNRDIHKLQLLDKITHPIETTAYLISWTKNSVNLYLPDYKLLIKHKLFINSLTNHFIIQENGTIMNQLNSIYQFEQYKLYTIQVVKLPFEKNINKRLAINFIKPLISLY